MLAPSAFGSGSPSSGDPLSSGLLRRCSLVSYGLFNMGDNVHEWCAAWYDAHYYDASSKRNPPGPPTGSRRASRGGSWRHHIKISRVAARSSLPPEFKYADYDFRIAGGL